MMSLSVKALCILCLGTSAITFNEDRSDYKNRRSLKFHSNERRLSYTFETNEVDARNVDLDLAEMNSKMKDMVDETGFDDAKDIYSGGGHAKSIATLSVTEGLKVKISKGDKVGEKTTEGIISNKGVVAEDAPAGATEFKVQYEPGIFCYVGSLKTPKIDGCFSDSVDGNKSVSVVSGDVTHDISYDYTALNNTNAGLTLKQISEWSEIVHNRSAIYDQYEDFSNKYNFANEWIMAALMGRTTAFNTASIPFVDFDFAKLDFDGRKAAVTHGIRGITLWSAVVSKLQEAVEQCNNTATTNKMIRSWEQASAFYEGQESVYTLQSLSSQECEFYGTCDANSPSPITLMFFENLNEGKNLLKTGNCTMASEVANKIKSKMYIPLIQSTLRMAYELDSLDLQSSRREGQAAAMAASIAPALNACKPSIATNVMNSLKPGKAKFVKYLDIRLLIEQTYSCLGITCLDVSGLTINPGSGEYLSDAKPCVKPGVPVEDDIPDQKSKDDNNNKSTSPDRVDNPEGKEKPNNGNKNDDSGDGEKDDTVGIAIGSTVGIVVFLGLMFLMIRMNRGQNNNYVESADHIGIQSDLDLDKTDEEKFIGGGGVMS
jgi:hypothetical protein